MAITGYAGTVSYVNVKEDQVVYNGSVLLRLKNTATFANYDALLKSRADLEENLNELLAIYKEGGITAPISGVVETITETAGADFATISPEKAMTVTISVDETNILSLSDGLQVQILSGIAAGNTYYYSYLDTVNYETGTARNAGGGFPFGGF